MDMNRANLSSKINFSVKILPPHMVVFRFFKGIISGNPVPLDDTFRSYNGPDVDGTTFPGKPGKIDYVMVDQGATVQDAWIDRESCWPGIRSLASQCGAGVVTMIISS